MIQEVAEFFYDEPNVLELEPEILPDISWRLTSSAGRFLPISDKCVVIHTLPAVLAKCCYPQEAFFLSLLCFLFDSKYLSPFYW